ncbi:MAG: Carotene 7,8-desaturase [Planctomycetaceae bacterium]|nr:Carotene 7,8-desaturase [Planctomycetaceae bacterium]
MQEAKAASVGIVGGGLAGLAAAVALAERGLQVELFESRRCLGGRATSFEDPETGELLDNCQHVAMGCCTNFADFCRRTGIDNSFTNHDRLHFFGPDGKRFDFHATNWLPVPLHLAPTFMRLSYLSIRERVGVGQTLRKLARTQFHRKTEEPSIGQWLRANRQSEQAIKRFWEVLLVSALAESLEHASLSAARKVFVDGFLRARTSFHLQVPNISLQGLYDRVQAWLEARGAIVHLGASVSSVEALQDSDQLSIAVDGTRRRFDSVVVALPWRRVGDVLPPERESVAASATQIQSSPITSLHLWFDRELTDLPHAVLVDRLSQWVFARSSRDRRHPDDEHYYQVIISASRDLATRDRADVRDEVLDDLKTTFPAANDAKLLRWQMITEQHAVFSVRPGFDKVRPAQRTSTPNLMLAGDWTQTGWPATMEGAVRSGYMAAEAILDSRGISTPVVVPDLPVSWLSALLGMAP